MQHILVALMEDKPGVLNRIASLFRRRDFNIESLAVGHSETPGISRMTIVIKGDDPTINQMVKQLNKLINVIKVIDVTGDATVIRELALAKVSADSRSRPEVLELVDIFRAQVVDVAPDSLTIQITGDEEKVNGFMALLEPYGIKEMVRTGQVAMLRGSNSAK
ncbi:MAG: acetolactate synthase small subunit [Chloroflexota bacterium]|nr:acetolactate synthase small subunit [Chloroflexota bacterium]